MLRVAERQPDGVWKVNQWVKKAVLLGFRLQDMGAAVRRPAGRRLVGQGRLEVQRLDRPRLARGRLPRRADVRSCAARPTSRPGVVLMPSFVNLGAYVGEGTMVDTWATVGSCAQIGKHVHLSGGVGIGGVLEPLQAGPTIIEDNCFIGARSEVVEGVHRARGLGARHGRLHRPVDQDRRPRHRRDLLWRGAALFGGGGRQPAGQAASRTATPGPSLYCAVIVKRVDERTRSKTGINELLRD